MLFRQVNKTKNFSNQTASEQLMELLKIDSSGVPKNKLSEVVYFTCLKLLSESVAKLPLKLYQESATGIEKANGHELYSLMKTRPNPYMSSFNFWASVELNRNHFGNCFVYIDTKKGKVQGLYILPSDSVKIWVDDAGIISKNNAIWYVYTDTNQKEYKLNHEKVLHFRSSMSFDGITGLSVIDTLRQTGENLQYGQNFLNNYWKNGMMIRAILQYTGDINSENRNKMRDKFENMASGITNAGRILPVPIGFSLQTIENKLVDSQFLELSKYTAQQIASAMGIKPSQLGEDGKFNNVEMQQRSFYVDTTLSILTQYEQELSYKLLNSRERMQGYYFKFVLDSVLRGEFQSRMNALSEAVKNGIYTPNEARQLEEKSGLEGGDQLFANGNIIPLTMAGQQYVKGGEEN